MSTLNSNDKKPSDLFGFHNELNSAEDVLREIEAHEKKLSIALAAYLKKTSERYDVFEIASPARVPDKFGHNHNHHHHHHNKNADAAPHIKNDKHGPAIGATGSVHHNRKQKQTILYLEQFIQKQIDILIQQYCGHQQLIYNY